MLLKNVFLGLLLLVLGALGWSQRNAPWLQDLTGAEQGRGPNIRFDNGSVRDTASASEPASGPAVNPSEKPMTMAGVRKCARGTVVVYTDKTCPPGSKQAAIGGTVNVVDGAGSRSQPDKKAGPHAPQSGEATLREKYMEAVINR